MCVCRSYRNTAKHIKPDFNGNKKCLVATRDVSAQNKVSRCSNGLLCSGVRELKCMNKQFLTQGKNVIKVVNKELYI